METKYEYEKLFWFIALFMVDIYWYIFRLVFKTFLLWTLVLDNLWLFLYIAGMVTGITCVFVRMTQNINYLQTTKPFCWVKIRYAILNWKWDEKTKNFDCKRVIHHRRLQQRFISICLRELNLHWSITS